MLHDIAPHTLDNQWNPRAAQPDDLALYFDDRGVYLRDGGFPRAQDYAEGASLTYLVDYDGRPVFLADAAPDGFEAQPLRALRGLDQPSAFLGGTAQHLWTWYRANRFCGHCGGKMQHHTAERAMQCPACGHVVYPTISPAIIVLIHNGGDKLLLAQGKNFVGNFYSCIAGYLEIGESLEQCVRREALEEVGVHLHDITYFANQPWPYSSTQMVGFFARADENEPIVIQQSELNDAKWFGIDELPNRPQSIAIASTMINSWLASRGKLHE